MGVSLPQATNDCFAAGILRRSMTGDGRLRKFREPGLSLRIAQHLPGQVRHDWTARLTRAGVGQSLTVGAGWRPHMTTNRRQVLEHVHQVFKRLLGSASNPDGATARTAKRAANVSPPHPLQPIHYIRRMRCSICWSISAALSRLFNQLITNKLRTPPR
jgi:hypothetical protein